MGLLDKIFSKGADAVVGSVGKAIDSIFTNDEERLAKQVEIEKVKNDLTKEINRNMEAIMTDSTRQMELEIQDRSNARGREAEFVKSTGHMDWMMTIVGILVMACFIGTVWFVATQKMPEGSEHLLINAMGILEGMVMAVVGYYYGSSAGSRLKDRK